MKTLHRVVVGGGFGVLAMAGVASSVAFACTSQARLSGGGGAPSIQAPPGATVTIEGRGFVTPGGEAAHVGYGNPVFTWNGANGPVMGTLTEPTPVMQPSGTIANIWTINVQIPADATPSVDPYYVIGTQTNASGATYVQGVIPVYVTGTIPVVAPPAPQQQPNVTPPAATPGVPTPQATPQATPTAPTAAPAAAARPVAQPATNAAAVQGPTASPSSAAPSSVMAAPRATGVPSAPAAASAGPVDPTRPMAVPAAEELWSGLAASSSASALLDAPAPATSGSGFPAGAVLLGMGLLALAGTAALAGKRSLVLAKAVRS